MSAGRLTTHVLDTAHGIPAAGMRITLHRVTGESTREMVRTMVTNRDGRTDSPLIAPGDLERGEYILVFETGAYWAAQGVPVSDPPFLDNVPIRFGVGDPDANYHVPLLCSPWSYSTYRGS